MPRETAAISKHPVYTIQSCTMSHHFMQIHICMVYMCLAVTCHLHFWQNDSDLLHATAVTQGWNVYWNKSQHRKLTLEKILLPELVPETFRSGIQCANHWTTPLPVLWVCEHRPLAPSIIISIRVCATWANCDTCNYCVLPVLLSKQFFLKHVYSRSRDHFKTKSLILTFWFWFLHLVGKKKGLRKLDLLTSQTNEC